MPLSPDRAARNARILAAHSAGATIPQIAASLELDPSLVARVIRDAARQGALAPVPDPPPTPPAVDPGSPASRLADPAWLAEAYATRSARAIAGELGCPVHRVLAALQAAGIPRRSLRAAQGGRATARAQGSCASDNGCRQRSWASVIGAAGYFGGRPCGVYDCISVGAPYCHRDSFLR
jgi:hypothetical protein